MRFGARLINQWCRHIFGVLEKHLDMAVDLAIADPVELMTRCARLRATDTSCATMVNDARHVGDINGKLFNSKHHYMFTTMR